MVGDVYGDACIADGRYNPTPMQKSDRLSSELIVDALFFLFLHQLKLIFTDYF